MPRDPIGTLQTVQKVQGVKGARMNIDNDIVVTFYEDRYCDMEQAIDYLEDAGWELDEALSSSKFSFVR